MIFINIASRWDEKMNTNKIQQIKNRETNNAFRHQIFIENIINIAKFVPLGTKPL